MVKTNKSVKDLRREKALMETKLNRLKEHQKLERELEQRTAELEQKMNKLNGGFDKTNGKVVLSNDEEIRQLNRHLSMQELAYKNWKPSEHQWENPTDVTKMQSFEREILEEKHIIFNEEITKGITRIKEQKESLQKEIPKLSETVVELKKKVESARPAIDKLKAEFAQ